MECWLSRYGGMIWLRAFDVLLAYSIRKGRAIYISTLHT